MSTEKRVTFTEAGDPVVTITIRGWSDAFRFAWALGHLQCDFCDVGRRVGGSLKRRLGAKEFSRLNQHYTGKAIHRWVRHDDDVEPVEFLRGTLRDLRWRVEHSDDTQAMRDLCDMALAATKPNGS